MSYIEDLQGVIRRYHGVESKHLESVPVKERDERGTIWEGMVEVFQLIGHPEAYQAFGWSRSEDWNKKYVIVLQMESILSASDAVRAVTVLEEHETLTRARHTGTQGTTIH